MKALLVGGPHNGRKLTDAEIHTDLDSAGDVRILNIQSSHDDKVVDVYTYLEEKTSGFTEFLYHSSRKLN
ncbi:hypothetical protein PSP83_004179 [Salmonella enterica]|nr:hypothetical protein [Salmonella enterica]